MLRDPSTVTITDQAGGERSFILHKFTPIAGREIIAKYPTSSLPKIGEYSVSEETMIKLMAFVKAVTPEGIEIPLTTKAAIDNHTADWETLMRLEWKMLEYNCSFFKGGLNSAFFESLKGTAQPLISRMLTALSAASSAAGKPNSTSSATEPTP